MVKDAEYLLSWMKPDCSDLSLSYKVEMFHYYIGNEVSLAWAFAKMKHFLMLR